MGVESGDFISDLNEAWPLPGDERKFGDDHFRLIKHVLRYAFANGATSLTINAGTSDFTFNQDGSILVNGTPLAAGIPEAPIDGLTYGRSDGNWTEVVSGGAGGSAPGEWVFNNATAEPPGGGQIRFNNATQASSTKIYLSESTAPGVDVANVLKFNLKEGGQIYLQNKDNSTQWQLFNITGTPVDDGTYWDIPVTRVDGGSSLPDGQRTLLSILPPTTNATEFVKKSGDTMTGYLTVSEGDFTAEWGVTTPSIMGTGGLNLNGGGGWLGLNAGEASVNLNSDTGAVEIGGPEMRVTGGKATFIAPALGYATINLPHGTAPASPTNGDVWTTNAGMFARINGATVDLGSAPDLSAYAPLASPTFTGDPKAPTPATTDNDTSIATTAYVRAATLVKTGDSMSGALNFTHAGSISAATVRFGGTNTGYFGNSTTLSTTVSGVLKSTLDASAFTLTVPVVLPADPTSNMQASTKKYVDDSLVVKVNRTGDTMTGSLTIQPTVGSAMLTLDHIADGYSNTIASNRNWNRRWEMVLGNYDSEAGSNAGCNFQLRAFNDTGGWIHDVLLGTRSTGLLTVKADPTDNLGIATKQYVDGRPATDTTKVLKAGDTMSGALAFSAGGYSVNSYAADGSWSVNTLRVRNTANNYDHFILDNANNFGEAYISGQGNSWLGLNSDTVSGSQNVIAGTKNRKSRWRIALGNSAAESTGNAGSHFSLWRYDDAGTFIDTPISASRTTGAITFAKGLTITDGDIQIAKTAGYPGLYFNYANSSYGGYLQVTNNFNKRFEHYFDDTAYYFKKYNDAGVGVNSLTLNRSDGSIVIDGNLSTVATTSFGDFTCAGVIVGLGTFRSSGATATLATTGAGTCYMRPAGSGSTTGQIVCTSTTFGVYGSTGAARGALALPTGTISRVTYATGSVTLPILAGVVMAMITDLRAMGFFS